MVNLPLWQAYIERTCGFVLPETQHNWLAHAVLSVADKYDTTPEKLYMVIDYDSQMVQSLLDAVLIAESRFFRHEPSLNFVVNAYKYALKTPRTDDFGVWSVGCSTGQEVYSVALMLQLIDDQLSHRVSFVVQGSDLSHQSLAQAKRGQYDNRQLNEVPAKYRHYFVPISDKDAFGHYKQWQVRDKIRHKTRFFWQNLFAREHALLPKQDIIVCQNVLIYFRKFDQRDILGYFAQNLALGGFLLLAPNEAVSWQHPKMRRVDNPSINAWQKIAD